ncbi:MAG TPA: hypothetical protein VGR78_12860 [Verrucomicrobiae bacterium]|nr:hypothetical protein [Verrucomicrobiae bacterium]
MNNIDSDFPRPSHDITSFTSRSVVRLSSVDLFVGAAGLFAWILLFTGGALIGSEPYRKALSDSQVLPVATILRYSFIVLTTYTVTNVAMLCCISSMLGGIYRGSTRADEAMSVPGVIGIRLLPYLIQGFVIFLLLISGLFLLGEDPFANLSANKYIRMAGTASLFSFLAGYKPRIFYRWLHRFDEATTRKKAAK